MKHSIDYGNGIYAIDSGYVRPQLAAIYLIVERGRAAFFDSGTTHSAARVEAALDELGLAAERVDYVILSHVHLDHAGGAGALMRRFPEARLIVHPRGARHMIDPARLIEGSVAVYGEEVVRRLYGEIIPVDAARLIEATDKLTLDLCGRALLCLDTPGHARHHIALIDERTRQMFTGDIFGVSYRKLDVEGRQFVFPTTTPVQFDPDVMHVSIDRLMGHSPTAAYLTHFGQVVDLEEKAAALHRAIDGLRAIALAAGPKDNERHHRLREGVARVLLEEAHRFGAALKDEEILRVFVYDLELNAQGLAVWLDGLTAARS